MVRKEGSLCLIERTLDILNIEIVHSTEITPLVPKSRVRIIWDEMAPKRYQ